MLFGKPKSIISNEDNEWQFATFRWLLGEFAASGCSFQPKLITPTAACFPDVCESPEDVVQRTFGRVRSHAGMDAWPCILQPQEDDVNPHVGHTLLVQGAPSGPAGTFRVEEGGEVIISFNPNLVNNVEALVATFAHELAHYKLATFKTDPPGGHSNEEFATDLAAVFMGFGIFLTNTAFQFDQFVDPQSGTQGWRSSRQGYLSQSELVQALATFVLLFDIDASEPENYLREAWINPYRKALKYLKAEDIPARLKRDATT
jgi:hypothetical protein